MESRKRVLVIEDDPEVLFVWATALKKLSEIQVETAEGGQEALDQFDADPFDLVITDLSMPGMSGVELTREIRRLDTSVPIIWVTAHAHFGDSMDEPGFNVHTFLVKPVSIQQLRQVVRDALQ
jgi:DNA-binding NtrC family response regulator